MSEDESAKDGVDEHQEAEADVREDEGCELEAEAQPAAHLTTLGAGLGTARVAELLGVWLQHSAVVVGVGHGEDGRSERVAILAEHSSLGRPH